jgi:hypothetical protein
MMTIALYFDNNYLRTFGTKEKLIEKCLAALKAMNVGMTGGVDDEVVRVWGWLDNLLNQTPYVAPLSTLWYISSRPLS